MKNPTEAQRISERELVVKRTINGPARLVFEAWTKSDIFRRWWVPEDFPVELVACEIDARVGGKYRLVFAAQGSQAEFFGRYLEVTPGSRLVWTNEEAGGDGAVTTVTFVEQGGRTLVTVHDLYPSKAALDEAIASGSTGAMPQQLEQLDALLATRG
jgi:uncharacterized protein YndB with AHSA1/START domain